MSAAFHPISFSQQVVDPASGSSSQPVPKPSPVDVAKQQQAEVAALPGQVDATGQQQAALEQQQAGMAEQQQAQQAQMDQTRQTQEAELGRQAEHQKAQFDMEQATARAAEAERQANEARKNYERSAKDSPKVAETASREVAKAQTAALKAIGRPVSSAAGRIGRITQKMRGTAGNLAAMKMANAQPGAGPLPRPEGAPPNPYSSSPVSSQPGAGPLPRPEGAPPNPYSSSPVSSERVQSPYGVEDYRADRLKGPTPYTDTFQVPGVQGASEVGNRALSGNEKLNPYHDQGGTITSDGVAYGKHPQTGRYVPLDQLPPPPAPAETPPAPAETPPAPAETPPAPAETPPKSAEPFRFTPVPGLLGTENTPKKTPAPGYTAEGHPLPLYQTNLFDDTPIPGTEGPDGLPDTRGAQTRRLMAQDFVDEYGEVEEAAHAAYDHVMQTYGDEDMARRVAEETVDEANLRIEMDFMANRRRDYDTPNELVDAPWYRPDLMWQNRNTKIKNLYEGWANAFFDSMTGADQADLQAALIPKKKHYGTLDRSTEEGRRKAMENLEVVNDRLKKDNILREQWAHHHNFGGPKPVDGSKVWSNLINQFIEEKGEENPDGFAGFLAGTPSENDNLARSTGKLLMQLGPRMTVQAPLNLAANYSDMVDNYRRGQYGQAARDAGRAALDMGIGVTGLAPGLAGTKGVLTGSLPVGRSLIGRVLDPAALWKSPAYSTIGAATLAPIGYDLATGGGPDGPHRDYDDSVNKRIEDGTMPRAPIYEATGTPIPVRVPDVRNLTPSQQAEVARIRALLESYRNNNTP